MNCEFATEGAFCESPYCLYFYDSQYSQVGLPLVEPIQGIVVRAEILRRRLPLNRLLKHPTQRRPFDNSAVNTEADDTARELVHHNQNPMRS